jgi:hypothetical protein
MICHSCGAGRVVRAGWLLVHRNWMALLRRGSRKIYVP